MFSADVSGALFIVLAGLVPFAGLAAWLVGLVLHGLGRPTGLPFGLAVVALGVGMGTTIETALGSLERTPTPGSVADGMIAFAFPLLFVVGLGMMGRRRAAGQLLAGTAIPWTAVSGMYVVDLVQGADWAPAITVVMFGAGLVLLVLGGALAVVGDRVPVPDPGAAAGRPGSRRPGSLATEFLRRARYGLVGPAFLFALVAAAVVSLAVPSAPAVQALVVVGVAVVATEVELRWIPPAIRPALEAFHWEGRAELEEFRRATGRSFPATLGAMRTWLARTPETDADRRFRVEILGALGRFDEARAALERLPDATPEDRLHRAALADELRWRQGGPADVPALAALAAEVGPEGDPARVRADALVAFWASQTALAAMDPAWPAPLAAVRPRLDGAAGLHATALRGRTLAWSLIPALLLLLLWFASR